MLVEKPGNIKLAVKLTNMSYSCVLQKPILLQGHERSITQIKYNREGDLIFSVAKDTVNKKLYTTQNNAMYVENVSLIHQ